MSINFEELDYRPTDIGALSLRRRRDPALGIDVFEIKLGEEYLMSSLFTASEIALATLGLARLKPARPMSPWMWWWAASVSAIRRERCWTTRPWARCSWWKRWMP